MVCQPKKLTLQYPALIIFALWTGATQAQDLAEQDVVKGIVKDAQTFEPVSSAHVITDTRGTFTDQNGFFSLRINASDTVLVSHVEYQPFSFTITDDTVFIFLTSALNLLSEVEVLGLSTEERFKQSVLKLTISPSVEQTNAQSNLQNAKTLFLSGYVPIMSSSDNYRNYTAGPQNVSLFSTGPNKGIAAAIKAIRRNNNLGEPIRLNGQTNQVTTFIKPKASTDTTIIAVDTLRKTN